MLALSHLIYSKALLAKLKKNTEIALISDAPGWHCEQLQEAFAAHQCEVKIVALNDCTISTQSESYIQLPGFTDCLPDGVFVRGVPAGSLESVVFHLDILHGLARLGVHVYNDAQMIERSVDKAMTSFLLKNSGIATPPTWVTVDYRKACAIVQRLADNDQAVVLKPLFGSQGKDLQLIHNVSELPELDEAQPRVYYLQQFIENSKPYDWRVFVVGDQVVSAMQRQGCGWVNNAAQGAECRHVIIDDEASALAIQAMHAVGLFYGGVDLISDTNNTMQVIEINSIPAWKSLQSVSSVNVAEYIVDHFMATRYCRDG